ncbi:hypothetical protein [Rhizobium sp. SAFR-030]|uniref:hypothetical protein n=1 Tax=Rhizobium sp. SAFR-030 TaxID=3387277 RepID=UPI003F803C65
MGQSISAYLKAAGEVKSVRQIHVIATAVCEDRSASPNLRRMGSALLTKVDRVIHLPIASAAVLGAIWRDFNDLRGLLEQGSARPNPVSTRQAIGSLQPKALLAETKKDQAIPRALWF